MSGSFQSFSGSRKLQRRLSGPMGECPTRSVAHLGEATQSCQCPDCTAATQRPSRPWPPAMALSASFLQPQDAASQHPSGGEYMPGRNHNLSGIDTPAAEHRAGPPCQQCTNLYRNIWSGGGDRNCFLACMCSRVPACGFPHFEMLLGAFVFNPWAVAELRKHPMRFVLTQHGSMYVA